MKFSSYILGCGGYLPKKIITNNDLPKKLNTTDEWIKTRTGICQRYIANKKQLNSDLGFEAAKKAIKNSKINNTEIDLVIVATSTPDHTFPSTATKIQGKLGIKKGFAFDVQAACSGFIYAISIADNYIKNKQARNALVIGSEVFSRILDCIELINNFSLEFGTSIVIYISQKWCEFKNDYLYKGFCAQEQACNGQVDYFTGNKVRVTMCPIFQTSLVTLRLVIISTFNNFPQG